MQIGWLICSNLILGSGQPAGKKAQSAAEDFFLKFFDEVGPKKKGNKSVGWKRQIGAIVQMGFQWDPKS